MKCSHYELQEIDDDVQDGILAWLAAERRGTAVECPFAYAYRAALHARLRRRHRMRCVLLIGDVDSSDQRAGAWAAGIEPTDRWSPRLRSLGKSPTPLWQRILFEMACGNRTDRGIARALERHPSSIHEARTRLRRWLEDVVRAGELSIAAHDWVAAAATR